MAEQVSLTPVFSESQFFDNNGVPLAGGLIYTYEAGGATSQLWTFTTSAGDVQNLNPIVLDSTGRPTTEIWLVDGNAYNLVLTESDGTTVLRACDNIVGIQPTNISGSMGTVVWNVIDASFNYVSSTQFYFAGDWSSDFRQSNRVQYKFTDGSYAYGVVLSSNVSDGNTYVNILPDSVNLSNTVTAMAWSVAIATNYVVDAGAVGYTPSISYGGASVGAQIQALYSLIANYNKSATTTLSTQPNYTVQTAAPINSYTNIAIDVIFAEANGSVATTLNVNGIGVLPLYQYDYTGAKINPVITVNMCARIMSDNAGNLIITTPLTPAPQIIPPVVPFGLGINQTWQNETSNRVIGTNYTNSSTAPIMVSVSQGYYSTFSSSGYIDGNKVVFVEGQFNGNGEVQWLTMVVPAGSTYMFTNSVGVGVVNWWELK